MSDLSANRLTDATEEIGNPFTETSKDLFVLDSRDFADPSVIDTLRQIKSWGRLEQELVENYCAVVARRDAWDYVSVSRQDFNALLFALLFGGLCARS